MNCLLQSCIIIIIIIVIIIIIIIITVIHIMDLVFKSHLH